MLATNHNPHHADHGLLESAKAPVVTAVFHGLLDAREKQGYNHGYRTAVVDIIGSVRLLVEEFAHEHFADDPSQRQTLREFEAYLRRHILSRNV